MKAILGAVAVLLIAVVYLSSGGDPEPVGRKALEVDPQAADAVRQRLDQLRSTREQGDHDVPGSLHVDKGVSAPAAANIAKPGAGSKMPQPVVPAQRPPDQIPPAPRGGNVTGSDSIRDNGADDIPALKLIATADKDPEKRLEAVTLLGATDEPEVVPVLGQALTDEDPEVRLAAIQALADFTGDAPFDLLGKAVTDDPEPDNRYEALEALSDQEDERASTFAKKALQDPDEDVRGLAESILGMDENPKGMEEQR